MEKIFNETLSNMTTEVAYKAAVRHLYDLGKSVSEIEKECLYPVSQEVIERVIEDYVKEKESPEKQKHYIEETDRFGRRSFREI